METTTTFELKVDRFGIGDYVSATPCCGKKVKLSNETTKWARHCTGGCRRVYDVRKVGTELKWTEREQ